MPHEDLQADAVLSSIAFSTVDDLLVMCHSSAAPSDEEWNSWIERQALPRHRAILISTAGGAPNSAQRARVAKAVDGISPRPPVALLTDSAVLRSLMTAFSWLLGADQRIKGFSPTAVAEAVSWLGVSTTPVRVEAVLRRLHTALGSTR
jgi:hypothetical protein